MTQMRRWSIYIVEDQVGGSPEGRFSELLYSWKGPDGTYQPIRDTLEGLLDEEYCDATESMMNVDFVERRNRLRPRRPIIDVSRKFQEAWREFETFPESTPDIVLLDVRLDAGIEPGTDEWEETRDICTSILRETDESYEFRLEAASDDEVTAILKRGGLFLLGHLIRKFPDLRKMPFAATYSASTAVQREFAPISYALGERWVIRDKPFSVVEERQKALVEARLIEWLRSGRLEISKIRTALTVVKNFCDARIRNFEPNGSDFWEDALRKALSTDIGCEWRFGTFFVFQSPRIAEDEDGAFVAVSEIEQYLKDSANFSEQLGDLLMKSPLFAIAHHGGVNIRPPYPGWLVRHDKGFVKRDKHYATAVEADAYRLVLRDAFESLHGELRTEIEIETARLDLGYNIGDLLSREGEFDPEQCSTWERIRNSIRCHRINFKIDETVALLCGKDLKCECLSPQDKSYAAFLLPEPKESKTVPQPLNSLLTTIVGSIRKHSYPDIVGGRVVLQQSYRPMTSSLILTLAAPDGQLFDNLDVILNGDGNDDGSGDPFGAIRRCEHWMSVGIISGGRRLNTHGDRLTNLARASHGCTFEISLYALPE